MRNKNNGELTTASSRGCTRRIPTTSTYIFLTAFVFLLGHFEVYGFTAKLAPPWTAGGSNNGGGGGNKLTAKRRKKQQADVKLLVGDEGMEMEEEEEVISLSSSSSSSTATTTEDSVDIKTDSKASTFPSEESTLKAAKEYCFPDNAAVLLSKEVEEHMRKYSSSEVRTSTGVAPPMPTTSMRLRSHNARLATTSKSPTGYTSSPTTSTTVFSSTSLSSNHSMAPSSAISPHLSPLLKMCRLSNLPGVVLFHLLGIYLSLSAAGDLTGFNKMHLFLQILTKPSMLSLLLSTILISVTSMVVNDYYDAKSGVDSHTILSSSKGAASPLASGLVPFSAAKRFLVRLYAMLLVAVTFVPGVPARLCVMGSTLITYWYTQHFKPRTWTKNASVSLIIAMTPFASGSACAHLLGLRQWDVFSGVLRLFITLFAGFMGREVLMDIRDAEGDGREGIPTIPVKYGRRFASRFALGCTCISALLVSAGPLVQVLMGTVGGGGVEMVSTGMRRLVLGMVGGALVVNGGLGVVATEGGNEGVTSNAIEMAKVAILFFLGSFV